MTRFHRMTESKRIREYLTLVVIDYAADGKLKRPSWGQRSLDWICEKKAELHNEMTHEEHNELQRIWDSRLR